MMDMLQLQTTIQKMELRITQLESQIQTPQETTEDIFFQTTKILMQMQIPANLLGYYYIRDAVVMLCNDETLLSRITKELYPTVGRTYKTTSSRVERGIRFAFETAWNKAGIQNLEHIFGESVHYDKPTNSEALASIADYLKLRRR